MSDFGVQLGLQDGTKIDGFEVQEPTYVARAENVKMCTTLKRKRCFCLPRTPKNFPKSTKNRSQERSMLRSFLTPIKIAPGLSRNPL